MAKQTINLGSGDSRGDGESVRSAFDKCNDNFTENYASIASIEADIATLDGSKIVYGDLSVTTASASGAGSLTYNSATGVFTFTPAATVAETNDLSAAVTWTNIPDAYVPQSAVTQHQAALTITQSQISDLTLTSTGDITFDATTIGAPDEETINIQATNADSSVNSRLVLDPSYGTITLETYSEENNRYFDTSSWSTGEWISSTQIRFTGASALYDFLNGLPGDTTWSFSVDGGDRSAGSGYGYSFAGQTLTLGTDGVTGSGSVSNIRFYYVYKSYINVDYDDNVNIVGNGLDVEISSDQDIRIDAGDDLRLYSDDILTLYNNSATTPTRIVTDDNNNSYTWAFEANGSITFPDSSSQTTAWTGTITESQISDLGSYITGYTVTESDVTAHQAALTITESQISDLSHTSTGNFTFSNNGITTANAASNITIAINGATAGDPPAFVSKQWSFDTDGSFNFHNPLDLPSLQASITATKVGQWDTAVGWGDHSSAGYLTSVSEAAVTAHQAALSITESQVSDLGTYVESDTTGITGADQVTNIVTLTQAEYDAIGTPNASTVYIIVG